MFERFTDGSRRVMVFAQDEVRRLSHQVIAPHHLALGLIREEQHSSSGPLTRLGIDLEELQAAVTNEAEEMVEGRGTAASPPFTATTKRVLELSLREALRLEHKAIGPGHMLLALLSTESPAVLCAYVDARAAESAVREEYLAAESSASFRARERLERAKRRSRPLDTDAIERALRGVDVHSDELLLALVAREDTLAGKVLAALDVDEVKIRQAIHAIRAQEAASAPLADNEVRVGTHSLRIDDPQSREALLGILKQADLAERIQEAMDRRAKESG